VYSKEKVPLAFARVLRTCSAASVMSTPMPSPGMAGVEEGVLVGVETQWVGCCRARFGWLLER